jgi:hypothetical protein
MLSGTHVDSDVEMAYAYGGNSFVAKPDDYHEYMDRVIMLLAYWLGMNTTSLPNPFADLQFRDEGLYPPTTWREAAALAGAR